MRQPPVMLYHWIRAQEAETDLFGDPTPFAKLAKALIGTPPLRYSDMDDLAKHRDYQLRMPDGTLVTRPDGTTWTGRDLNCVDLLLAHKEWRRKRGKFHPHQ